MSPGEPALFYLRIADDPTLALHQEWVAECVRRGVYFTNHHNHFLNASLTDADIAETVAVARRPLKPCANGTPKNNALSLYTSSKPRPANFHGPRLFTSRQILSAPYCAMFQKRKYCI